MTALADDTAPPRQLSMTEVLCTHGMIQCEHMQI